MCWWHKWGNIRGLKETWCWTTVGLDTPAESGPGVMRDALLMERVDGDGVGGRRKGHNRSRWCVWRPTLHGCSNPLQTWGDAPERPQQHRHPAKTGIYYFAASRIGSSRWRAPGKSAVIIAIRHGTSAPALKGNVRWRSDWLFSRYAQTTPSYFRPTHFRFASGARVIYPAGIIATAAEIRPQSYLRFAFHTCVSDR